MCSNIYNILRRYHICVKCDNKTFYELFFVVWLVNGIVELELSFMYLK